MADVRNGDGGDISDKRLAYIYKNLVKTWKFKIDKWDNMMKTADFNVCIKYDTRFKNRLIFILLYFYITVNSIITNQF